MLRAFTRIGGIATPTFDMGIFDDPPELAVFKEDGPFAEILYTDHLISCSS